MTKFTILSRRTAIYQKHSLWLGFTVIMLTLGMWEIFSFVFQLKERHMIEIYWKMNKFHNFNQMAIFKLR